MEIKKPEISAAVRMRARKLVEMLKERVWTKRELEQYFYPGSRPGQYERQVRDLISTVAEHYPVISTSDKKGYWIATAPEHIKNVLHSWKEIDSRIEALSRRKEPYIKFYEQCQRGKYANHNP